MPSEYSDFDAQRLPDESTMPPELRGPDAAPDELRPIYDRLQADARAWSATIASDAPLVGHIRSLPRGLSQELEEATDMGTSPDLPNPNAGSGPQSAGLSEAPGGGLLRGRALPAIAAAILIVALLGGALYALGLGRGTGTTPTATPTATSPQPTLTPAASPTVVPTTTPLAEACGTKTVQTVTQLGDLLITPISLRGLPGFGLPDDTPLAPYRVNLDDAYAAGNRPLVDRPGNDFYGFDICNASATTTHTLQRITMRIASLTAYNGQLNAMPMCADLYARQGIHSGGCGYGLGGPVYDASFAPDAQVGAVVDVTPDNTFSDPSTHMPFPLSLAPGQEIHIGIMVTRYPMAGTYTFTLGFAVDGAAPTYATPATVAVLYANIAHEWRGIYCQTDAMLSQIPPATNPPTYYVCPHP